MGNRRCTKCGELKPLEEFYRDKSKHSGFYSHCKQCILERQRRYDAKHSREIMERRREYFHSDKEQRRQRSRDRRRQTQRYYQENKERILIQVKQWQKDNPGKKLDIKRRRRALVAQAEGVFTQEEFVSLCERYGFYCLRCGNRFEKLTADHVVPLSKGGSNSISNIQPLCGKCNSKKHVTFVDYRHDSYWVDWT